MQCDFLDYRGGLFGGHYYCSKEKKDLDRDTIITYCDNSLRYRDCPIFRKSDTTCYLTTTMYNILGFDDHCKTLDTLRSFRDDYMKKEESCLPLLENYDNIGPMVSQKLLEDENRYRTAHIMLFEYLTPAVIAIENKDYDDAIEIYKNMTLDLMDYYNIDRSILASKIVGARKQRKIEPLNV